MASANSSRCGVYRGTLPNSCPHCRDVPESDIDSPLTSWACLCGWCHDYHAPLCQQRQIVRTITRVISLQQVLFLRFKAATTMIVTWGYENITFPDGVPGRVIWYKNCSRSAANEPVFMLYLPEEVRIQACCVEGCVLAIAVTTPILAWWVEGMPIELQEFNAVPNPARRIVMRHLLASFPDSLAELHTSLLMAPYIDQDHQTNSNWRVEPPISQIWSEASRVSDSTFPQFDYDRNGHTAPDYLREKVKGSIQNRLLPFGSCFQLQRDRRERAPNIDAVLTSLIEEWGIRTMSDTVHRVTEALGGREQLLVLNNHEEFMRSRQLMVNAVQQDLKIMRRAIDGLYFRPHLLELSRTQIKAALLALIAVTTGNGYRQVMEAYHRRTRV